jgi:glycosyltransferase involved in cell wall biosynthesis
LNILLVSQYFWPERFRVNDLVAGWEERGHAVTVLTGIPNYAGGAPYPGYTAFGPSTERLGRSRIARVPLVPRGSGSPLRMAANYLSFALLASVFGPARCRGSFDLIFVFQMSPVTMAIPGVVLRRLRGIPLMIWVQDLWPESLVSARAIRSRPVLGLLERLVRGLYRRCDLLVVQSEDFVEPVVRRGADPARVRYLPNWAESFYRPVDVPADAEERRALPEGFVILFAGNLGEVQALDTILDAADLLREERHVQWVFMGEGRRKPWLEAEIVRRGLGATVHVRGSQPSTAMPAWACAADALLVTLRADPVMALTVPSKLQSCLACARPVLAALDGAGAEAVRRAGAGLVGPAGDAAALAANALRLSRASAEELAGMGRSGRAHFLANFERELVLDRLDGWMREVARAS